MSPSSCSVPKLGVDTTMDDRDEAGETGRRLRRWLREEVEVRAPDRVLEDALVRAQSARQAGRGRLARPWWFRGVGPGPTALGRVGRALPALAVVTVVAIGGGVLGARLGAAQGPAVAPSAVSAGGGRSPDAPTGVRQTQTCSRQGSLVVLQGGSGIRASAWVTCGVDSEEVVLGTDTGTPRPGLGVVATDGTSEWAIRGDSVAELTRDRSIIRSVRIGTPSAIAVGASAVWVLDARTGDLASIGANGIVRRVAPAPAGRPIAIAIAAGSLWVLDQGGSRLLQLDLVDGHEIGANRVSERPTILTVAAGSLYVASPLSGTIVRVDAATGRATTLRPDLRPDGHIDALGGSPDGLALGSRAGVYRLDPTTAVPSVRLPIAGYVGAVGLYRSTVVSLTSDGVLEENPLP